MGHRFQNGQMNLPDTEYLEGFNFDPLPYFLIGDEIFPARIWLMGPIELQKIRLVYWLQDGDYTVLLSLRQLRTRRVMFLRPQLSIITSGSLAMRPTHQKVSLTQKIQLETLQQGNDVRMQTLMSQSIYQMLEAQIILRTLYQWGCTEAYVNSPLGKVDQ